MGLETLQQDIEGCTTSLLEMARDHCWNQISQEVVYIISEIKDEGGGWDRIIEQRRRRDSLKPMDFETMIDRLKAFYPQVHDLNLYVHRAERHQTVIDVRYFSKAKAGYENEPERPSMLHAKIALPPYRRDGSQKFDVHWEFGGLRHQWRLFWWRWEFRRNNLRRGS